MNKFLTAGVSALTTFAICTGVVGILATAPSTRNMFDFTGQKEQIISELAEDIINKELIIKEKDFALLEQDEEIAGLKYANNEKDTIITEKDSEINNKNAEIKGQQATIEELNDIISTFPKKYDIEFTDDMVFPNGVTLLNISEDIVIFSSVSNKGTQGLWKFDKRNGILIQLVNVGYNYTNVFQLSDGRNLIIQYVGKEYIITDSLFNEFDIKTSLYNLTGRVNSTFTIYENDIYFTFSNSNHTYVLNKITHKIADISAYNNRSCMYENYLISGNYSTKLKFYNLEDGKLAFEIDTTSETLPIVTEKGIYLLSTTQFLKLNFETKELVVLQDGLNLTSVGYKANLYKDGIYVTSGSSMTSCLIDTNEEKVVVLGNFTADKLVELNNVNYKYLVYSGYYLYLIDYDGATKGVCTLYSVLESTLIGNKYLLYYANGYFYVYDLVNAKSIFSMEDKTFRSFTYEEIEDGKYKIVSNTSTAIFDSVNNTFSVISIVIE